MDYVMLKDVCAINMGQSPDSNSYNDTGEGTPFFQGNADFGKINPVVRVWCDLPTKIAHKDDILISVRAPIGALNIADRECCIGRGLAAITTDESKCANGYLWYALSSRVEELNSKGTGSTFKAISKSILAETEIPLPSIDEQRCIAAVLDKAAALIDQRKQQLAKLDELVKARFVEIFGDPVTNTQKWEIVKLDSLCNVGSSKRIYQNEQSNGGIPFLRISDLVTKMDTGETTSDLFIPEEKYNELVENGLVPKDGDILVTARGTLGRCYIIQESDRFYFQDGMITWLSELSESITALYISQLFDMGGIKKQIDELQAGSTVAYLSIAMTKKLDIMLPPIELQNQFAAFVKQLDKSKAAIQKSLDEAQLLFDSLMQKYFG